MPSAKPIRCFTCRALTPPDAGETFKTTEKLGGRAWRCTKCGDAERERITAANLIRLGRHG